MVSTSKEGLRQRHVTSSKKNGAASTTDDVEFDKLIKANTPTNNSDLQYKIALAIITALAFVTRFWGISHPSEVVFDEVHFGKVCIVSPEPRLTAFLQRTVADRSLPAVCLLLP